LAFALFPALSELCFAVAHDPESVRADDVFS
jgi:hypothetical protein